MRVTWDVAFLACLLDVAAAVYGCGGVSGTCRDRDRVRFHRPEREGWTVTAVTRAPCLSNTDSTPLCQCLRDSDAGTWAVAEVRYIRPL